MKPPRTLFALVAILALAAAQQAKANIVGYVNNEFQPGFSLFGNPLKSTNNNLSSIMFSPPEGTSVMTWNPAGMAYNLAATYSGGMWIGNTLLNPGTGAALYTPSIFTNTFVGEVEDANGNPFDGMTVHPPAPFAGPNGLYLWNNKLPVTGTGAGGYSLWQLIVGRMPNDYESFYRWNRNTESFDSTTYYAGYWYNGDPFLNVGEAGFFDIGGTGLLPTIPEPSSSILVGLGLLGCVIKRRFRR